MKKKIYIIFAISLVVLFLFGVVFNLVVFPKKFSSNVQEFSRVYRLESALVFAIIKQESDFDKNAISRSGALGLMQILPSTAKWIAGELKQNYAEEMMFNPNINIEFGCFYLRYLFDKFEDVDIVVCAYNAGEKKVLDWCENGKLKEESIDYPETMNYLKKVKGYYNIYKSRIKFM